MNLIKGKNSTMEKKNEKSSFSAEAGNGSSKKNGSATAKPPPPERAKLIMDQKHSSNKKEKSANAPGTSSVGSHTFGSANKYNGGIRSSDDKGFPKLIEHQPKAESQSHPKPKPKSSPKSVAEHVIGPSKSADNTESAGRSSSKNLKKSQREACNSDSVTM